MKEKEIEETETAIEARKVKEETETNESRTACSEVLHIASFVNK